MANGLKLFRLMGGRRKSQLFDLKPFMTIFAGPNGAGKSSLRMFVKEEQELGMEIDADAISRAEGLSDIRAGRATIKLVNDCIQNRRQFSLETTLSGHLILEQMRRAKAQGFYIRLLYISLDAPIEHITRIEQRSARGGHYIPPNDVERRYYRSHENLPTAIALSDESILLANESKYEMIVRFQKGEIVEKAAELPLWAVRLL